MKELMIKELESIAWNVPEEEYRKDLALSYSTLAKYEREGFSKVNQLFDKVESPSLLLGGMVDCIMTDGKEEFEKRFMVAEFPSIPDSIITIVKGVFQAYGTQYHSLYSIPDNYIISIALANNYQPNWRPETRAKVIREKGAEYYGLLYLSENKTIVPNDIYALALNMVDALKNSPSTKWFFEENNPFDENIKRYYQLKFKATLNGIDYRCMADLLVVDYKNKLIIPVDLKTSYKHEYEFYKSFMDWRYEINNLFIDLEIREILLIFALN